MNSTIEELGLNEAVNVKLKNILLNDILMIFGTKLQMLEKYSQIMQTQYHRNESDPEEVYIKKILVTVVPKIMNLRLGAQQKQAGGSTATVTKDDKDVIKYISGAVLRWGLKKFTTVDDEKWLSTHISVNGCLAPRFERANKGSLIVPSDEFLAVILETEKQVRMQITADEKFIDEKAIVNTVCSSNKARPCYHYILPKLLGRYVRLRLHIHCRRLSNDHRQFKLKKRRATSLRASLKQNAK